MSSAACLVSRLCVMFLMLAGSLHAAGVVVWKEQKHHSDASSKALWFQRMEKSDPVTWFYIGSSRKAFEGHQPFDYIVVNNLSATELMRKSGIDALDQEISKLSAFARQYPAAVPLLNSRVRELKDVRKQYGTGTIYHEGEWLPIAEYEQIKARQRHAQVQPAQQASKRFPFWNIYLKLGIAVAGVLLLVIGLWWGMRRLTWAALILLLAGAGWLTWRENGYGWLREMKDTATRLIDHAPWR